MVTWLPNADRFHWPRWISVSGRLDGWIKLIEQQTYMLIAHCCSALTLKCSRFGSDDSLLTFLRVFTSFVCVSHTMFSSLNLTSSRLTQFKSPPSVDPGNQPGSQQYERAQDTPSFRFSSRLIIVVQSSIFCIFLQDFFCFFFSFFNFFRERGALLLLFCFGLVTEL